MTSNNVTIIVIIVILIIIISVFIKSIKYLDKKRLGATPPSALTCKLQSVTLNQIWVIVIVVMRIMAVVNFAHIFFCIFVNLLHKAMTEFITICFGYYTKNILFHLD